jgi:transposase
MPKKKYIVTLTPEERTLLEQLTKKGKAAAYKVNHARIMLLADTKQLEGGWKDEAISQALNISVATIERVRQRLVEDGLESALSRKPQENRKPRRLNGEQEAHLIALTCSEPPTGQGSWTMRMLANRMVELGYVEAVSHETVRQTLKKTNLSRG